MFYSNSANYIIIGYHKKESKKLSSGMDGHEPEDIDFGASRYSPLVDETKK